MPELPEVEGMASHLRRWTAGHRLIGFEVLDPKVLVLDRGDGSGLGAPVGRIWRRAKYLVLEAGGEAWIVHFRMTGQLVREPRGRARWVLDGDLAVGFVDPRRFGEIVRIPVGEVPAYFEAKKLGPEPWPVRRDGAWWAARLGDARGPLKVVMLDQARVAGVGNIAASEICWRARLSPFVSPRSLDTAAWERLAEAASVFLEEAVAACSAEEIVYVNQGGENPFDVYQRAGEACRRCGGVLGRVVQAGRSTYFCHRCQKV